MKIFGWMRNKLNGKDNPTPYPESISHHVQSSNEEFSDWPNALFAIGTLGNSSSDDINNNNHGTSVSIQEDQHEENEELDQDMPLFLNKHISLDTDQNNISIEKLLDCLPEGVQSENKDEPRLQRRTSVVHRDVGGKDVHLDQKKKRNIGKKSLSFLLKKALLLRGESVPPSILRDRILEANSEKSRMEKILRTMLHKKIYPQRPGPMAASKKYLDIQESDSDDEDHGEADGGSKWVKTDSECKYLYCSRDMISNLHQLHIRGPESRTSPNN